MLFLKRKTFERLIYFIGLCKNYHVIENLFQNITITILLYFHIGPKIVKTLQFSPNSKIFKEIRHHFYIITSI